MKVSIVENELYPHFELSEDYWGTDCVVDAKTLKRWKRAIAKWESVQDEMQQVYDKYDEIYENSPERVAEREARKIEVAGSFGFGMTTLVMGSVNFQSDKLAASVVDPDLTALGERLGLK
jgi:hypothetical protein